MIFNAQTALVVHTKWPVRRRIQQELRSLGWRVLSASNAEEAQKVLHSHTIQRALVERGLKCKDGTSCKAMIKMHPKALSASVVEVNSSLLPGPIGLPDEPSWL